MANIEVSVVMPCLNEEKGISLCLRKIKEVFAKENINGEIIVADNGSTDRSREICAEFGAGVFIEPVQGYGAAYLRGLKEAKGKYIIIADSDNTYDFGDIPKFLAALRAGNDFVIGSRFKGRISRGAMPWANRYIGNPILSGMTRMFFKTKLNDIHCGIRGFTADAYRKMNFQSMGMEFATEMVVSAMQNKLKIMELPTNYYARFGKSKLMPFSDAWRHIRFMLLYCPGWLYFVPGLIGLFIGLGMLILLLKGPVFFIGHYWDTHLAVIASTVSILAFQLINLGVFAHLYVVERGLLKPDKFIVFYKKYFNLERSVICGIALFFIGGLINFLIFLEWYSRGFGALYRIRESVFAMTLLIIGLQMVFSSFFIGLLFLHKKE